MSMAVKHGMNKRKKMAFGGAADLGEAISKASPDTSMPRSGTGVEEGATRAKTGLTSIFNKFADGGEVGEKYQPTSTATIDRDKAKEAANSMKSAFDFSELTGAIRKALGFAHGGEVGCPTCKSGSCMEHGGMADKIMAKRYSKGGMVANETEPLADSSPNEFDDLVLRDKLASSYTGKDSGDELGNAQLDEDDRSLVSRIMRSRRLKDRMPRPA